MRELWIDRAFRTVITVILVIVAVISLLPLVSVAATSFSSRVAVEAKRVTLLPVDFTVDSWKYVLTNAAIWRAFGLTVFITAAGTLMALLVTALMAYPLSKGNFKPGRIIMLLVVLTMIFKAPTIPYFLTIRNLGLYDNLAVLILPQILTAYNLSIMRTFFREFPREVEEAATIDGCSHFDVLCRIVLPSSKAVLATLALFYAVALWNQFQHPLLFIRNQELYPLQMKIHQLLNSSVEVTQISAISNRAYNEKTIRAAVVLFALIPILAVYPFVQKYFVKGAMLGSVKG